MVFLVNKIISFCLIICLINWETIGAEGNRVTDEILITEDVGQNISLACNVTGQASWLKNGINITNADKRYSLASASHPVDENSVDGQHQRIQSHILNIYNIDLSDTGNFTCYDHTTNETATAYNFQAIIPPTIIKHSPERIRKNITESATLFCTFKVHPGEYFDKLLSWDLDEAYRAVDDDSDFKKLTEKIKNGTEITRIDDQLVNITLKIDDITKKNNATYVCSIGKPAHIDKDVEYESFKSTILVTHGPHLMIDYVKAVGEDKIFLNWTINDGNDPIKRYTLSYLKDKSQSFQYYHEQLKGGNTSHVFDRFSKGSNYKLKLCAHNSFGESCYETQARTLDTDPTFVPQIEVKGSTHSTITIGWTPPPADLLEFIQYYEVKAYHPGNQSVVEEAIHPQNTRNLPYMFDNLATASEYSFRVRACSELTHQCGNWSSEVNGTTMDGNSSPPINLKVQCQHLNISRRNRVEVEWDTPLNPNGVIMSYHVVLNGVSTYRIERGNKNETWGPKTKTTRADERKITFEPIPPNTNYTVTVSGVTRNRRIGDGAQISCSMPPTVPDNVGRFLWGKVREDNGNWIFKLFLPRVSERNGPICCYRIYMVRIGEPSEHLPTPDDMDVMTYNEVHAANNTKGGAYIAEILTTEDFQPEIFLGDGKQMESFKDEKMSNACRACYQNLQKKIPRRDRPTTTEEPSKKDSEDDDFPDTVTIPPQARRRRRRQASPDPDNQAVVAQSNPSVMTLNPVFDGELNLHSNYTGFVEIIVENAQTQSSMSTFSEYFETMKAGAPDFPDSGTDDLSTILNISVTILCGLILIVLVLLTTLCCLHRYYSKNAGQDEVYTLTDSIRTLCYGRSSGNQHRHLITSAPIKPPDMPPIQKSELAEAYISRHKDSDYGFQHEFEMLPDRFTDRTTKNTDAKENLYKNRYPDIKSYDQTRVKLSMINSTIGSDYINANFVIGYKERKKFICAQGPMETTVNDFWRMIWEQNLEIIVMLTNLEEYNKTKCAKYWPEKQLDTSQFGDFDVVFASENRFSDYLIRELKVSKRNSSDDDQSRTITQYHYLNWKDFMAPEHPYGIIKFIRQINSVYSVQRGPILIHCSAGVGRTGTLVALDSMMQQLNEEGQVSVFNTICDLRHQRNFLVQSLKQYIFLYRALLDISIFGDTEIQYKGLSQSIENLKKEGSKGQSKLELEYEKIKQTIDDIKKTCAIANGEENVSKNRNQSAIPFDRNRVILQPVPGVGHSTYINASFIEGYDNSESFIITQDPIDTTIADFWRMVLEQGVNTIVMISEIGDAPNKCPRYWADDEIQYENIKIKYIQSESGPYYTRREFIVSSVKNTEDTIQVTQFQYQGWPTVEGEVPEVTRGICEIVNQAQKHHNSQAARSEYVGPGPILVHCNMGTDKSSIFVAMCILIQQLRLEKKVDICTTTRKLRSQRNLMIDSYAQYEFLHRAIVNYADLHKSSLDSITSAIAES
uniref:protein-tyrosine-phosphatase n=1 Tax=Culicoides sonorensis TaxID=179676 RepID=A0A336KPC3_CULSO